MNMHINGNGNTQVGRDLNITQNGSPPPAGHPNGAFCPQCSTWTWSDSRECFHCHYDLNAYYALKRIEERRQQLHRKSYIALAISAFSSLLAIEFQAIGLISWCVGFVMLVICVVLRDRALKLK